MRIGSLQLNSNLFLSPLAGYTNLPFRLAVRELGGLALATTDLVNARSLLEKRPRRLWFPFSFWSFLGLQLLYLLDGFLKMDFDGRCPGGFQGVKLLVFRLRLRQRGLVRNPPA